MTSDRSITVRGVARATAACATLLLLAACASGPRSNVTGSWNGDRPATPFTKVLVVGVSPDAGRRCEFERILAARLSGQSTQAVASCEVVDRKAPLTRELVEQAVQAQKADAVLATRLVSQDWAPRGGGDRDTRGSAGYKATDAGWSSGYYGVYGMPVVYGEFQANAESITIVGEADIASKLWSARGATLVYSLQTHVDGVETSNEGVSIVASAIADDLMKQGLVR